MDDLKLAPELLTSVLDALDVSDNAGAAITLCRFSRCSRLFHSAAIEPRLWRDLYVRRWRRHRSVSHELEMLLKGMDPDAVDWRLEYAKRHVEDRGALACMRDAVQGPNAHYAKVRPILEESRMNVFDALLSHYAQLRNDALFYERLPDKMWFRDVLDSLRKAEALRVWLQMVTSGGTVDPVTAISAFSAFRGSDRVELEDMVDRLVLDVRRRIGVERWAARPDQLEVAKQICQAMADNGIKPATFEEFHRLKNHFVNLVINDQCSTLPMTLVCIFCSIAQRLGIQASLVAFPQRIICRISGWISESDPDDLDTPQPSTTHVIDVFEGGKVLDERELHRRLTLIGIPGESADNFLNPARSTDLVARVGRNIIQSLQQHDNDDQVSHTDTSRSAHAAVAALLFLHPNNLVDALPNLLHQFPMDVYSIDHEYIPLLEREGREGSIMCDRLRKVQQHILERDSAEIQPRLREQERNPDLGDDKEIMHKIGTVFRHRRWKYIGVIRRWDPRCCADEGWMTMNNIDGLDNGGRRQPFYSISADDGSDRYIAQINILPMKSVALDSLRRIIEKHEDLATVFARADPQRALFVLNQGMRLRYPEDAAWEARILEQPPPDLQYVDDR